jgi:hypothetical protein
VSTDAKRAALLQVEAAWIDSCAHKGFQAVEPDNYESYSRSGGLLTSSQDVEFAKLIAHRAHADGVAIAQKNGTELLAQRQQVGFDFAVAEQCGTHDECGQYASAYGDHVVDVEYDANGFAKACTGFGKRLSIVRRDLDVSPPGGSNYVFKDLLIQDLLIQDLLTTRLPRRPPTRDDRTMTTLRAVAGLTEPTWRHAELDGSVSAAVIDTVVADLAEWCRPSLIP